MHPDLTQSGLIDWNNPEDVARCDQRVDHIAYDSGDGRLIEMTTALLGALGPGIPEERRSMLSFAALCLRTKWIDIGTSWEDGTTRDIGEALGKTRPKNWHRHKHVKHHRDGPLVFAEISFDEFENMSRPEAMERAREKYHSNKTQIETWYYDYKKELRESLSLSDHAVCDFASASFIASKVPGHIALAFCHVARSRGIDDKQMQLFERIRNAATE